MDKAYFLKKEDKNSFSILNQESEISGKLVFEKNSSGRIAFFLFSSLLLAVFNYYVFISFYLSFRLYGLKFLSFLFGLAAFGGAFYAVFSSFRFILSPYRGVLEFGNLKYELKSVSKNFLLGPKYSLEGEEFYALLFLKGLFFRKLVFLNQNKEKVFFVLGSSHGGVFKSGKTLLGSFSKTPYGIKLDLSSDLNSSLPLCAALMAASFYRR